MSSVTLKPGKEKRVYTRHPWVFRAADWEMLQATPCFWARKFDERVDAEIIDRIYRQLKPSPDQR